MHVEASGCSPGTPASVKAGRSQVPGLPGLRRRLQPAVVMWYNPALKKKEKAAGDLAQC